MIHLLRHRSVILYRDIDISQAEQDAMRKHFVCTDSRMDIQPGDLVVGRYSVLPFYAEQERDILKAGASLINTKRQHDYIADLSQWVPDLEDITPKTWYRLEDLPDDGGPFVLKGQTNSRKFRWDEEMFAATKRDAINVHCVLANDSLIGRQEIYIRQYVPLVTYMRGIHNLPITKEFRFFVAHGQLLCGAYYWASHVEDLRELGIPIPSPDEVPRDFLADAISRIGDKATFYALDVGQTDSGKWIVIEINDGQLSGLSENDPDTLYRELRRVLAAQTI